MDIGLVVVNHHADIESAKLRGIELDIGLLELVLDHPLQAVVDLTRPGRVLDRGGDLRQAGGIPVGPMVLCHEDCRTWWGRARRRCRTPDGGGIPSAHARQQTVFAEGAFPAAGIHPARENFL